jgi:hypothetical protein
LSLLLLHSQLIHSQLIQQGIQIRKRRKIDFFVGVDLMVCGRGVGDGHGDHGLGSGGLLGRGGLLLGPGDLKGAGDGWSFRNRRRSGAGRVSRGGSSGGGVFIPPQHGVKLGSEVLLQILAFPGARRNIPPRRFSGGGILGWSSKLRGSSGRRNARLDDVG